MTSIWHFILSGDLWDFLYRILILLISPVVNSLIKGFEPMYNTLRESVSADPVLFLSICSGFILYGLYHLICYLMLHRRRKQFVRL